MNTTDDHEEVDGEKELQQCSEYIQQKFIDEHDALQIITFYQIFYVYQYIFILCICPTNIFLVLF